MEAARSSSSTSRDPEFQRILSKVEEINSEIKKLELMPLNFDMLLSDSKNLSGMIHLTSQLAESVSYKVRQLDCAKSRVTNCLQRVEDIIDLKSCTDGVQQSLQDEDFEIAAAHIHRFLTLDENILRMTADASEGSTLEASFEVLRNSETKLKLIVHKQFDLAVLNNDRASIERFFKIFPLLNLHQAGLEKLGKYLCSNLNEECKASHIANSDNPIHLLVQLFESVAKMLEVHQCLVETFYGPGYLFGLVEIIQGEVDNQSRKIIDRFKQLKDWDTKLKATQRNQGHNRQSSYEVLNPKSLDAILSEVVLLSTRLELYLRFIRRRVVADWEAQASEDAKDQEKRLLRFESFVNNAYVTRAIQDLISNYCLFEEYYMREMIAKAVSMDTTDSSGCSSMVDDVFFILKKCLKRSLSSGNVEGICAMFNQAASVMDIQYFAVLKNRVSKGFPSGWMQDAMQYATALSKQENAKTSADDARNAFLVTLNNIEMSKTYVKNLCSSLQQDLSGMYAPTEQSRAKMINCLSNLSNSTESLGHLLDSGMNSLTVSVFRPQVKVLFQPFCNVSHILTESHLTEFEVTDPWVEMAIQKLDVLLQAFKVSLQPAIFDVIVQTVTVEIVNRFEKEIYRKDFNRIGGIQLERELRSLISYITNLTTWSVRDKFSRLNQISILLSVESTEELVNFWNDSMTWRLTPSEVRQFLHRRTDIRSDDVRKLRL